MSYLLRPGRLVGLLFLLQLLLGIASNTVLTAPLFAAGGYLVNAGAAGLQLGVAVLAALTGALLTLGIALLAFAPLAGHSALVARAFLALSIVGASLSGVEQAGILAMRDYSAAFLAADAEQQALLASLSVVGAQLRNGVHYVGLLFAGVTLLCWYTTLLRFRLLPGPLAALGVVAVCLQLFSIGGAILGGGVNFALLAPLALAQLLMSLWLLWRGFPDTP